MPARLTPVRQGFYNCAPKPGKCQGLHPDLFHGLKTTPEPVLSSDNTYSPLQPGSSLEAVSKVKEINRKEPKG